MFSIWSTVCISKQPGTENNSSRPAQVVQKPGVTSPYSLELEERDRSPRSRWRLARPDLLFHAHPGRVPRTKPEEQAWGAALRLWSECRLRSGGARGWCWGSAQDVWWDVGSVRRVAACVVPIRAVRDAALRTATPRRCRSGVPLDVALALPHDRGTHRAYRRRSRDRCRYVRGGPRPATSAGREGVVCRVVQSRLSAASPSERTTRVRSSSFGPAPTSAIGVLGRGRSALVRSSGR